MAPIENMQHLRVRKQECPFNSSLYVLPSQFAEGPRYFTVRLKSKELIAPKQTYEMNVLKCVVGKI